ncbi:hypothetical protein Ancab_038060 [Ancistrocladus abbreviatus]
MKATAEREGGRGQWFDRRQGGVFPLRGGRGRQRGRASPAGGSRRWRWAEWGLAVGRRRVVSGLKNKWGKLKFCGYAAFSLKKKLKKLKSSLKDWQRKARGQLNWEIETLRNSIAIVDFAEEGGTARGRHCLPEKRPIQHSR